MPMMDTTRTAPTRTRDRRNANVDWKHSCKGVPGVGWGGPTEHATKSAGGNVGRRCKKSVSQRQHTCKTAGGKLSSAGRRSAQRGGDNTCSAQLDRPSCWSHTGCPPGPGPHCPPGSPWVLGPRTTVAGEVSHWTWRASLSPWAASNVGVCVCLCECVCVCDV